ncbi:MAG: ParB/RepB/Spo0J family partition protein [Candidatus Saccharibacteria bacterium]|nr:ParB/RepB/Spo0J family partition protein [Candidatus Saccharibacteria bacterium]
MSAKKRGLGRGFSSLIPDELFDESFDPTASQDEQVSDLRTIKLAEIAPDPDQPRRVFDEAGLEELAASIREHGVLQPIVVVPREGGYMIVAGERRWRAATIAKLDKIPAIVRTLSDQHKLELSLIENLQRHDLNPIETATAYVKLRDQFNLSLDTIARRMGAKSVSTISNKMRLLKLPKQVRLMIAEGSLTEGQVRPLIGLDEAMALDIAARIAKEGWSARKVEQLIVQLKQQSKAEEPAKAVKKAVTSYDNDIARLSEHLGAKVKISSNSKGAGRITIAFKDADEYARLQKLLER